MCLPELPRNMAIKSILMKDCESKPVFFQSAIFKTSLPGTHEVLAFISKISDHLSASEAFLFSYF